jgi:hypothetical protein
MHNQVGSKSPPKFIKRQNCFIKIVQALLPVNEKSIVSLKYMKSNKKDVFNVNCQYNHKQVPTAYFNKYGKLLPK